MEEHSAEYFAILADEIIQTYPFESLDSMKGRFAHINFNWRSCDVPSDVTRVLIFGTKHLQSAGASEREVSDFFAHYLKSTLEGYRKQFLDTVFGASQLH